MARATQSLARSIASKRPTGKRLRPARQRATMPGRPAPAHAPVGNLSPRVRQLVESPTYLQADEDPSFLQRPEMCGVRLQLDYWKTEERLQKLGIDETIVVYGSTRIVDPQLASRRLADAQRALEAYPGAPANQQAVRIAARLLERSGYYDVARELGKLIGRSANSARPWDLAVVTGGGPGIMEAANRGAYECGAPSIGLNISLPHEQLPNPYLTPDLCFRFHYFAIRKLHLLERAKAAVFFPGGYGTCDELFEVLTLLQTGKIHRLPVVLVGESFWRTAIDFELLVDEGMIAPGDTQLYRFCETEQEIGNVICSWHEEAPKVPPVVIDRCQQIQFPLCKAGNDATRTSAGPVAGEDKDEEG